MLLALQRGICVMIQSWTSTVIGIGSGAIAYMTSEQLSCGLVPPPDGFPIKTEQWGGACFTAENIWWCDIWILILQLPLYCLCCNGKAFDGCSWDGIWKPEKFVKRVEAPNVDLANDTRSLCERWSDDWYLFSSAFRDPCYRWLWIQGLVGRFGSMIGGQFSIYWYQGKHCAHGILPALSSKLA
jgi:hypothetical protein